MDKNRSTLLINIDPKIKQKFKYLCYADEISMGEHLENYIKNMVKDIDIPKRLTERQPKNKKMLQGFPKRNRTGHIAIKIDKNTKEQFDNICSQNNITMSDCLRDYVRKKTENVKNE